VPALPLQSCGKNRATAGDPSAPLRRLLFSQMALHPLTRTASWDTLSPKGGEGCSPT